MENIKTDFHGKILWKSEQIALVEFIMFHAPQVKIKRPIRRLGYTRPNLRSYFVLSCVKLSIC